MEGSWVSRRLATNLPTCKIFEDLDALPRCRLRWIIGQPVVIHTPPQQNPKCLQEMDPSAGHGLLKGHVSDMVIIGELDAVPEKRCNWMM